MNFRFFSVIIACFVTLLCNAQVQVSTKLLIGTKWEATSRTVIGKTETPHDKTIIEFNKNIFSKSTYYKIEPTTSRFKYYISDTKPSDNIFNDNLVGTNNKGKYIVLYNDKLNKIFLYAIISFNDDEIVLHNKTVTTPALDCYVTYKRIK